MAIMKATNINTEKTNEGLFFNIEYAPVEDNAAEAIKATYDFLNEFCPYEADEVIEDWERLIVEDPESACAKLEDIGRSEEDWDNETMSKLYDKAYDAIYDCALCAE